MRRVKNPFEDDEMFLFTYGDGRGHKHRGFSDVPHVMGNEHVSGISPGRFGVWRYSKEVWLVLS